MTSLAKYSFLPWLRQGIANKIVEPDNLGAPIPANSSMAKERPELRVKLSLNTTEISKKIKLHGPGDILGINNDAVLKVHPKAGTQDFESNALAYIEFYEEDFPWRYTPADRLDMEKRLRPWLFLIVAKEGEYDFQNDGNGLPFVSIKNEFAQSVFPSQSETWAWAHVHVNHSLGSGNLQTNLENELSNNPDIAYSRLICPRRLERTEEGVKYHAFLIPTFETGRLAGLGEDPKDVFAQKAAWKSNGVADSTIRPHDFPVYYNWEFKTGQYGDFETLVKILKAKPLGPGFGKRDMSIQEPGMGLNGIATSDVLGFEGALKPPAFSRSSWGRKIGDIAFREKLKNTLNISQDIQEEGNAAVNPFFDATDPNVFYSESVAADPIVTPPIYGKWHALAKRVGVTTNKKWVDDLNLDPRNRAAASIGTQTVRKHQEKFMEMAWQQIGEINEANQKIREAELAKMVNNALYEKHYAKMDEDKLLMLTTAAQKHIVIPDSDKTFEAELSATKIPNAARSAAFKKIIRPGKKVLKKINRMGEDESGIQRTPIQQSLMRNFNLEDKEDQERALTVAKRKVTPDMAISTGEVESAINYFLSIQNSEIAKENEGVRLDDEAIASQRQFLADFNNFSLSLDFLQVLLPPPPISNLVNFTSSLFTQMNPMVTFTGFMQPLILTGSNQIEKIKPIMAYPELTEPMFLYLQNLSQDFIIPNIREIPENTITLLENNQVFIESFMAGLNHEMSKELLWREYPTDQRGSYFRNFWDDKDSLSTSSDHDIMAMDQWESRLGEHNERIRNAAGQLEQKKNFIVLVIRGDVLKKYPNTVIYAQKAAFQNPGPARTLAPSSHPENIKTPIFQASLDPDIAMFGFNLTVEEARGNTDFPAGWFFVMQERPGEITFGLDDSDTIPTESAQNWNDLEWGHLVPQNGSLDNLNYIPCTPIRSDASNPNWGTNSAEMAYILYQMPVIFARHAEEMLP